VKKKRRKGGEIEPSKAPRDRRSIVSSKADSLVPSGEGGVEPPRGMNSLGDEKSNDNYFRVAYALFDLVRRRENRRP